jgi:uncharacterized protein YybS (DUF2232 family)
MHNRSSGVRGLVFGGIMAAMVVVFALVPFLSIFLPIPLVLAYVRYGGRVAVLTAIVAVVFSALFVGPIQAFLLMVPAGVLPGLAFGYGFRHKLRPLIIGVIAVLVFFVGSAAGYVVTRTAVLGGRDPIVVALETPAVRGQIDQTVDLMDRVVKSQPTSTEQQKRAMAQVSAQLNEFRSHPLDMAWALLPASLFMTGAVSAWLNYLLCRWILPRFGHAVPEPTPFREFRLPAWFTGVFVALLFASSYMGGSLLNAPWWLKLVVNISSPLMLIFVLVGMAVVYGFLRKKDLSKPLAVGFTLAGLFLLGSMGSTVYMMLAMWDAIFDFRGLGHGLWKRPTETP